MAGKTFVPFVAGAAFGVLVSVLTGASAEGSSLVTRILKLESSQQQTAELVSRNAGVLNQVIARVNALDKDMDRVARAIAGSQAPSTFDELNRAYDEARRLRQVEEMNDSLRSIGQSLDDINTRQMFRSRWPRRGHRRQRVGCAGRSAAAG